MNSKRLLFFGAHPDDCDILCGGTAIQWSEAGHKVKFVSVTNGDTGHQTLSRAETAVRRKSEAEAAGLVAGIEYQVLDHPCGLEASIPNRYELMRIVREFRPDVVISHRLCDYHPDHRAAAQLVLDTAYIVMVPHYCEETPIPEKCPVYAFSYDRFTEPRPHRTDAIVEFDRVLDRKLAMFHCHASQYYEWLPWSEGLRNFDAEKLSGEERRNWLLRWCERFKSPTENAREQLCRVYGKETGSKIVYGEVFEQSPYSLTLPAEEFQKLMLP